MPNAIAKSMFRQIVIGLFLLLSFSCRLSAQKLEVPENYRFGIQFELDMQQFRESEIFESWKSRFQKSDWGKKYAKLIEGTHRIRGYCSLSTKWDDLNFVKYWLELHFKDEDTALAFLQHRFPLMLFKERIAATGKSIHPLSYKEVHWAGARGNVVILCREYHVVRDPKTFGTARNEELFQQLDNKALFRLSFDSSVFLRGGSILKPPKFAPYRQLYEIQKTIREGTIVIQSLKDFDVQVEAEALPDSVGDVVGWVAKIVEYARNFEYKDESYKEVVKELIRGVDYQKQKNKISLKFSGATVNKYLSQTVKGILIHFNQGRYNWPRLPF